MTKLASKINPKLMKAAVYGANDGIITTFAVVAGVAGANLPVNVVLILGVANLLADGVSMGVGDYLGERSEQRLRKQQKQNYQSSGLWHTGLTTWIAFVVAGMLPLLPYLLGFLGFDFLFEHQFALSIVATACSMFLIGSLRTLVTKGAWWKNGLEVLAIGAIAATVAYVMGATVEQFVGKH